MRVGRAAAVAVVEVVDVVGDVAGGILAFLVIGARATALEMPAADDQVSGVGRVRQVELAEHEAANHRSAGRVRVGQDVGGDGSLADAVAVEVREREAAEDAVAVVAVVAAADPDIGQVVAGGVLLHV